MFIFQSFFLKTLSRFFFSPVGRIVAPRIVGPAHGLACLADAASVSFEGLSGTEIAEFIREGNRVATEVREDFPRPFTYAKAVIVTCMDYRLYAPEIAGTSSGEIYWIRVAGGILPEAIQEMIEIAVIKGCRYLLLTTHRNCAAEKVVEADFPVISAAVRSRAEAIGQLLKRPRIAAARREGVLVVQTAHIDTTTGALTEICEL